MKMLWETASLVIISLIAVALAQAPGEKLNYESLHSESVSQSSQERSQQ